MDFTDTKPPVFTKADEPLEADDWLRTMEQKFDLIHCTEFQKPVFATQQLRGAAGAWYANLMAMQPAGVPLTWTEFRTAFRAHYILEGVMAMKLDEFLALRQGDQTVMQLGIQTSHEPFLFLGIRIDMFRCILRQMIESSHILHNRLIPLLQSNEFIQLHSHNSLWDIMGSESSTKLHPG